jgi:hypothetical protein
MEHGEQRTKACCTESSACFPQTTPDQYTTRTCTHGQHHIGECLQIRVWHGTESGLGIGSAYGCTIGGILLLPSKLHLRQAHQHWASKD